MPLEPKSDKGYLVPDNPSPTEFDYRLIKIPNDPQWRETYSYLVGVLTFGYVWDKDSGDWEAAITTAMDILNCFIGLGVDCMTVCEIVADCIANDAETQAAIATAIGSNSAIQAAIGQYIKSSGYNTPQGAIDVNSDTINSIGGVGLDAPIAVIDNCDNDKLWGAIRFGVVKYLEDNAVNFLEDLNTIADKGQRVNSIIGGIPIIGDVLSASINAFVEAIPDLLNLFNSYASETTQDNAACELFQIGCNTCTMPTYRQLLDYYGNLGVTGYDDLSDVAFQLATDLMIGSSTLTGSVVYHTMIAYEIMVLYLGSRFNQAIGINIIDTWALVGVPFGNNTWIALCGGCGTPAQTAEWDFTINNGGFIQSAGATARGVYVSGVGWETEFNGNEGCLIEVELPANCVIKAISFDWDKNTSGSLTILAAGRDVPNSSTGQIIYFNTTSSNTIGCTFGENSGWTHRNYLLLQFVTGTSAAQVGHITKCRFEYEGDTPLLVTSTGVTVDCP